MAEVPPRILKLMCKHKFNVQAQSVMVYQCAVLNSVLWCTVHPRYSKQDFACYSYLTYKWGGRVRHVRHSVSDVRYSTFTSQGLARLKIAKKINQNHNLGRRKEEAEEESEG